jgi:hypothetical protein
VKIKSINDLISWNLSNRAARLQLIYVDITNDLIAGLLLSQIIYWNMPNNSGENRLKIIHNDRYWLCKSRKEWFNEIRITERQYDRASKLLCDELNIIDIDIFKYGNTPKTHIAINYDILIELINKQLKLYANKENAIVIRQNTKPKEKQDIYKEKNLNILNNKADDYIEAFRLFCEHRIKIKKPMTEYAKYLILSELEEYFPKNDKEHINRFNKSIKRGWQGVIFNNEKKTMKMQDEGY